MNTCKQCGFINPSEARFCQKCGSSLEEPAAGGEAPDGEGKGLAEEEATAAGSVNGPGPWKKKKIWIPVSAAIIVIFAAAALFFVLERKSGPVKAAENFLEALERQDTEAVLEMSFCPDFELTEEKLKPMLDLYASDESFRSDLAALLKEDVDRIKSGEHPNVGDTINLAEAGGFPFHKFKIRLSGAGIQIRSNLAGASVSFDDGSLKLDDGEKEGVITDLLPGTYCFSGSWLDARTQNTWKAPEENKRIIGYGDTLELAFPCTTLNIWLSDGLEPERIMTGGKEITFVPEDEASCYSVFPVTGDMEFTLEVKNKWGTVLTEAFQIPANYTEEVYDYQSTISSSLLAIEWPSDFTVKEITVNNEAVDLSGMQENSITIPGILSGEQVVIKAEDPFGQEKEDTFTAQEAGAGLIYHEWQYQMTEEDRESIAEAAGNFLLKVLKAYNEEELNTLEQLADDYKNEFAATFLELYRGRNEMGSYFSYQPEKITADKSLIQGWDSSFSVHAAAECTCVLFEENEKTGKWKKGDSQPDTVSGIFTVSYNKESNQWEVTEGRMDFTLKPEDIEEPVEIPVK